MALIEVALDEQLEQELNDAAQAQRTDQSGIVRQALAEYLRSGKGHRHDDDAICDDWQDFSRTVQEAQRRAIIATIRTLPDRAWTSQRETCRHNRGRWGHPGRSILDGTHRRKANQQARSGACLGAKSILLM